MNSKKVNWAFLCMILLNMAMIVLMLVSYIQGSKFFDIDIVLNLLLSQMILMLPVILFVLFSRGKTETGRFNEMLGFHKIKIFYDHSFYLFDDAADDGAECNFHAFCG